MKLPRGLGLVAEGGPAGEPALHLHLVDVGGADVEVAFAPGDGESLAVQGERALLWSVLVDRASAPGDDGGGQQGETAAG
ncbi:hypothetical protein RB200_36450 [Streptomyces sp. PmtG]